MARLFLFYFFSILLHSSLAIQFNVTEAPIAFDLAGLTSTVTFSVAVLNCSNTPLTLCIIPFLPPPRNGWNESCLLLVDLQSCDATFEIGVPPGQVWLALNGSANASVVVDWTQCNASRYGPACGDTAEILGELRPQSMNSSNATLELFLELPAGDSYYQLSLPANGAPDKWQLPAQMNITLALLDITVASVALRRGYLPSSSAPINDAGLTLNLSAPSVISLPSPPFGTWFLLFTSTLPTNISISVLSVFCPPSFAGALCNTPVQAAPSHSKTFQVRGDTLWSVDSYAQRFSVAVYHNSTDFDVPMLEILQGNVPSDVFIDARIPPSDLYPVSYFVIPQAFASSRFYVRLSQVAEEARIAVWLNLTCPHNCSPPDGRCVTEGDIEGMCVCHSTAVLSVFDCDGALPDKAEKAVLFGLLSITLFAVILGLAHYFYRRHKLVSTGYATLR